MIAAQDPTPGERRVSLVGRLTEAGGIGPAFSHSLTRGMAARPMPWRPRAIALFLTALFWAMSCGTTATATPALEPTPTPTLGQVLDKAGARMLLLDTARFKMEHSGETTHRFLLGAELRTMAGQVDMPDSFEIKVEADSNFGFIELDVIRVGDQAFVRDIIRKDKWNQIDLETLPFNFVNLGRIIVDFVPTLQSATFADVERVNGTPSWHIVATLPSESMRTLVPAAAEGNQVQLGLWIGQEDDLLRKIRVEGEVLPGDSPEVVRVITIDSFDEPSEISLP